MLQFWNDLITLSSNFYNCVVSSVSCYVGHTETLVGKKAFRVKKLKSSYNDISKHTTHKVVLCL